MRDGASETYALILKSRLLGENPCNVDKIFRKIKQFGAPARQAGGVCGVEMALMDLAGKAWGVPCWQMLGGKFRDRVRLYADTTETEDPKEQGERLKERMDRGITFLKQDFGIDLLEGQAGHAQHAVGRPSPWGGRRVAASVHGRGDHRQGHRATCPTGSAQVRDGDRHGDPARPPTTTATSASTAASSWRGRWRSGIWRGWKTCCRGSTATLLKQIRESTTVPVLTGEDIYLKEDFIKLIDMGAVDMIHPDLASAGGLIETKKIGDYAQEHGVPMAMHFAGSPVSFMANVHCAAATENFIALEHHSLDVPWWEIAGEDDRRQRARREGLRLVPDSPGLGVEPNEEIVKAHLRPESGYFEPTPSGTRSEATIGCGVDGCHGFETCH